MELRVEVQADLEEVFKQSLQLIQTNEECGDYEENSQEEFTPSKNGLNLQSPFKQSMQYSERDGRIQELQ